MLAALGWLIATIGVAGSAGCIALQGYFVWRANIDPETKAQSQSEFMIAMAACFGFFLVGIVGVILLQVSGAYGVTH